ncbi:MAG: TPM domain-containing protein [Stomatobaculum sp.]|nr:TPM domain-containing protein [Stomatobaculum sp.]
MKIMKKFCAFAVCLVLMLAAALSVYAADERVYDAAGLFSQEQVQQLNDSIASLRSHTGMDAVVVTATNKKGKSTQDFAEECYYTGGFGEGSAKSGFLYFIDMEERVTHISTAGGAITVFSDSNLDNVMDRAYKYLGEGDFAGSAQSVISDFVGYYDKAIDMGYTYDVASGVWSEPVKKKSLSPLKLLISALISALTASGSVNSVKRKYAMKDEAAAANKSTVAALAIAGLGFAFANQQDDLIDSHTVRRAVPIMKNPGKADGGGNKPFGGSTTHTGAGGMTFGGKTGGKF